MELVRAGALAVPAGQSHAALALGLTRGQAMGAVILPQALRMLKTVGGPSPYTPDCMRGPVKL